MKADKYIGVHLYSDETGFTAEYYRVPLWLRDAGISEYACRVAKRDYPDSDYLGWEDMRTNNYHKAVN